MATEIAVPWASLRRVMAEARAQQGEREQIVPFLVFDAETDRVLRSGSCQRMDVAAQALAPNEIVLEGERVDPDKARIVVDANGPAAETFIPVRVPTVDDVKRQCRTRIERLYPEGKQLTVMRKGGKALGEMSTYIDACIDASHVLEARVPIPADYADDKHWPA